MGDILYALTFSKGINKVMPIIDDELRKYKINLEEDVLRIFAEDVISILYGDFIPSEYDYDKYDCDYDHDKYDFDNKEDVRDMVLATLRGLSRPIIKDELKKNKVVMENRYIWLMTYDIVQELRKRGVGYCGEEIRKITQEYITKEKYKGYIDWLDASLSISITERELTENKVNIYGGQRWLMTYDILKEAHKSGKGYSKEEIRKITQEYITKGLYKNYIGRAGSFNDDKIL
jgi:hypothetical protein